MRDGDGGGEADPQAYYILTYWLCSVLSTPIHYVIQCQGCRLAPAGVSAGGSESRVHRYPPRSILILGDIELAGVGPNPPWPGRVRCDIDGTIHTTAGPCVQRRPYQPASLPIRLLMPLECSVPTLGGIASPLFETRRSCRHRVSAPVERSLFSGALRRKLRRTKEREEKKKYLPTSVKRQSVLNGAKEEYPPPPERRRLQSVASGVWLSKDFHTSPPNKLLGQTQWNQSTRIPRLLGPKDGPHRSPRVPDYDPCPTPRPKLYARYKQPTTPCCFAYATIGSPYLPADPSPSAPDVWYFTTFSAGASAQPPLSLELSRVLGGDPSSPASSFSPGAPPWVVSPRFAALHRGNIAFPHTCTYHICLLGFLVYGATRETFWHRCFA